VVAPRLADRDNIGATTTSRFCSTPSRPAARVAVRVNPLGVQQDGVRSEGIAGAAGGGNAAAASTVSSN